MVIAPMKNTSRCGAAVNDAAAGAALATGVLTVSAPRTAHAVAMLSAVPIRTFDNTSSSGQRCIYRQGP
jgi:hypothetical protein